MKRDNILALVRDIFVGDPVKRQRELLDNLAKVQAEHVSSVAKYCNLVDHFASRVANIDHSTEWWEYARAKQSLYDNTIELEVARSRKAGSEAAVREALVKLDEMTHPL